MPNMRGFSGNAETNYAVRASRPFYWYTDGEVYIEAHTGNRAKKVRARQELVTRDLCPDCMQRQGLCVCS